MDVSSQIRAHSEKSTSSNHSSLGAGLTNGRKVYIACGQTCDCLFRVPLVQQCENTYVIWKVALNNQCTYYLSTKWK